MTEIQAALKGVFSSCLALTSARFIRTETCGILGEKFLADEESGPCVVYAGASGCRLRRREQQICYYVGVHEDVSPAFMSPSSCTCGGSDGANEIQMRLYSSTCRVDVHNYTCFSPSNVKKKILESSFETFSR